MWYKCYIVWAKAWTACVGFCAVWSPWQTPIYQSRGDHSPSLLEGNLDRKESAVCGLCENWPQRNVLPKAARKKNFGWESEENEQRLSVTARTGRKQSRLAEETKHERRPTIADGTSGRLSLKHTAANICTTADGRYPENRGLHHEEWAQEEMAAFHRFEENLRHYHCSICKEVWPLSGFPTADIYLLQMQARQKAVSIIFCWERRGSWKRSSRTTRPQWSRGTADCTSVPDNVYLP